MTLRAGAAALMLLLASAALAAALPHPQEPAEPAAEPKKVLTGPELFASSGCSHCHAIDGVGGHKGPELSGIGRRWKDQAIRNRIEHGALAMPAYADVLAPEEVSRLVAYLHTRRAREARHQSAPVPPVPVPVTPIPE